jgi:GTP-binding protein
VNRELRAYNELLAQRPQIVVATKIDALDEPERLEALRQQAEKDGLPFYSISSVANKGTQELIAAVAAKLDELKESNRRDDTIQLAL